MSRKPTPPREHTFETGCAVILIVYSLLLALGAYATEWWPLLVGLMPAALVVLYVLYGFLLRVLALLRWSRTPVRGILIYSNSPKWQEYIEREWLPRFGDRVIVLNWSERKKWTRSLAVCLFRYHLEGSSNAIDYNPSVILLRGCRYPYLYRYFYAFRNVKHGDDSALKKLEGQMFEDFGVTSERPGSRN